MVKLKSFQGLCREAWQVYRRRVWVLLGLLFLPSLFFSIVLLAIGGLVVTLSGGVNAFMGDFVGHQLDREVIIGMVILGSIGTLFGIWMVCTQLIAALDDDCTFNQALIAGWQNLLPFGFVCLIYTGIVMTGIVLAVLPGILFACWFFFAFFFLLDNNCRGIQALQASRMALRGRFWNVLFKLFLLWLIKVLLFSIPWVGKPLAILAAPFFLFFLVGLYRDLKETSPLPTRSGSMAWGVLSAVGVVVVFLGMVGAVVTVGPQLPEILFNNTEITSLSKGAATQLKPIKSKALEVSTGVVWRDPVGDSVDNGARRLLDIQGVTLLHIDEDLEVSVHLAEPLNKYFVAAQEGGEEGHDELVKFLLDVDMDRSTGGAATADSERVGYDFAVVLHVDPDEVEKGNGSIRAVLFTYDGGAFHFLETLGKGRVGYSGRTVHFSLPYQVFHGQPGKHIRGCFVESVQAQGKGLSKDKVIEL